MDVIDAPGVFLTGCSKSPPAETADRRGPTAGGSDQHTVQPPQGEDRVFHHSVPRRQLEAVALRHRGQHELRSIMAKLLPMQMRARPERQIRVAMPRRRPLR